MGSLNEDETANLAAPKDWNERPLPELIEHIVDGHHVYTRVSIARLKPLMQEVVARHGDDRASDLLAEIQAASHEPETPADACKSYSVLCAGLREHRLDLLQHISLESDVLFPRAIALEDARA